MGPEATAVLVGVVVGFILGFVGDLTRETWRERRDSKAAARMIFAELVANLSAISTALNYGEWFGGVRQSAWEAYGAMLVRRPDWEGAGRIALAYSASRDAQCVFESPDESWKKGDKDDMLERLLDEVATGLRHVSLLAGESKEDTERRLGTAIAFSKRSRGGKGSTGSDDEP